MKIGVVISVNDAETCWNAFRFANFALGRKDEVSVFLMGKGVEYQAAATPPFNAVEQADKYLRSGGRIFACGKCMESRKQAASEACPLSTMQDMYDIVRDSDRVVTF